MKDGKYSNNVQKCGNSDLFGSNLTREQNYLTNSQFLHARNTCAKMWQTSITRKNANK